MFTCQRCSTRTAEATRAVPSKALTQASPSDAPIWVCPACVRSAAFIPVVLCDDCLTLQPLRGGSTGTMPVAETDDGYVVEIPVIWRCAECVERTNAARRRAGLRVY